MVSELEVALKKKQVRRVVLLFTGIMTLMFAIYQNAVAAPKIDWGNGALAVEKAGAPYGQISTMLDGKGNVLLCWDKASQIPSAQMNNSPSPEYYVQKFGADGSKLWSEPVFINKANGYSANYQTITSDDGLANVWVEARDKRKPDIYAQKINGDGKKVFGDNGIAVYAGPGAQEVRNIVSDNSGGFIVIWYDDERIGLYMQRIDASGNPVWQKDGISLNDLLGIKSVSDWPNQGGAVGDIVNVASDGKGGFYLVWNDFPENNANNAAKYFPDDMNKTRDGSVNVQHIDANGNKAWFSNFSIPFKNAYMSNTMPSQLTVLEDSSVLLQWTVPFGKSYIVVQTDANSSSGYQNPNNDYYIARILPSGESVWDYSKPRFETRVKIKDENSTPATFIMPMAVKGGVVFFKQLIEYTRQTTTTKSPSGEMVTEEIIPETVNQELEMTKLDFDGKVIWKKQLKSSGNGLGPIIPYGPYNADTKNAGVESFFLQSYANIGGDLQIGDFQLIKCDSITGAEKWRLDSKDIPNIKNMMWPNFTPDNKGGSFITWCVGLDPVKVTPQGGVPALGAIKNGPITEYKQSNIYIQHISDDGSGWSDLQASNWAYSHVQNLVKKNAISGYGNGEFKPEKSVTRAEFVKMIVRALDVKGASPDGKQTSSGTEYSDIKGHWAEDYFKTAISSGILNGYADGAIRPDAKITRAEAVAMVCRAKGIDAKASVQDFKDVAKDYWAFDDIEALSGLGTIGGYGDDTFRPSSFMTRAESAKVVDLIANVMK